MFCFKKKANKKASFNLIKLTLKWFEFESKNFYISQNGQICIMIADLSIFLCICIVLQRDLRHKIIELKEKFQILTLTGPRQTGKTTLLKSSIQNNNSSFNFII